MKASSPLIYLDANATTPVLPDAAKAAMEAMQTLYGNPSSSHITGLQAKALMEQTRLAAKKQLGSRDGTVLFTSGATEGIQSAILSALLNSRERPLPADACLLYGATEHKAVPESLRHWNKVLGLNAKVLAIPVDKQGRLDYGFITQMAPSALIICTMAVNNETGVYQDLTALDLCIRSANPTVFWMVDCVQALGKLSLELASTSIDYAPFSGHKLYAPKGIGMLYVRQGAPFTPVIAGGGQEGGLRSGTENLPAMAALKVVLDKLNGDDETPFQDPATLAAFRLQLIDTLEDAFGGIVLNHNLQNSVPTTLNFAVPGFSSKEIMDLFDAAGIRVSSGSACSSKVTGSFVLDAMGLPRWQSEAAIRLSFGPAIRHDEVDMACERIKEAAASLTHACLLGRANSSKLVDSTPLSGLMQFKAGADCCWLYIEPDSRDAVVIDPHPALETRLIAIIQCQKLKVRAVLDTHGHGDHVSARDTLLMRLGLTFDTDALGWPINSSNVLWQGEQLQGISLGKHRLLRLNTPGHTADSVALIVTDENNQARCAFVGDTVLPGSLGRTNFASSSAQALFHSLKKLHTLLGDDCLLLSSHDYHHDFATNFATEISHSPLLAALIAGKLTEADFNRQKAEMDDILEDKPGESIMCGAYQGCSANRSITEYSTEALRTLLANAAETQVIDIREPHEYQLSHLKECSTNVPLTRLADFVLNKSYNRHQPMVLICRSGSRSQLAAKALGRLGFTTVAHVAGGYALCDQH